MIVVELIRVTTQGFKWCSPLIESQIMVLEIRGIVSTSDFDFMQK